MLIAPSEPKSIKILGKSSTVPERFGADVLFSTKLGMVGVQRKEISDLIASLQDGRLTKEIGQLQRCAIGMLVVEGRLKWSTDGALMGRDYGQPWTRTAHRNLLRSVQQRGIWVEATDDTGDTVVSVLELQSWANKKHDSLARRPGPQSPWGKADSREWAAWFLQGLEGVGPELAQRMVEKFGRPPLAWTVTADDLMSIDGVGPKKAKQMMEALA